MPSKSVVKEMPAAPDKTTSEQEIPLATKPRKRITRQFPAASFEDCLSLANAIWEYAAGQRIRRLTLFDQLGKSPESGTSRTLVSAACKYRIISGSTQAEYLELTPEGSRATNPESSQYEKSQACFELAIKSNLHLFQLYEQYKEMKVPSQQVMMDFLSEKGLDSDNQQRCVDLFFVNAKFIGLLKVMSGTERILSIEHLLEDIPKPANTTPSDEPSNPLAIEEKDLAVSLTASESKQTNQRISVAEEWNKICFYITPIGDENSTQRKHADLFMESLVKPAVESLGLKVVRSDTIDAAGIITTQIIEHLYKSSLVIADLSFHNPNVFYELSFRHSIGKPVIHLIRSSDPIPFDIHSFRTIKIDDSDIYTFVPQIESYRATISAQARQLTSDGLVVDNPITVFLNKNKEK